jgi:hypothetical protein
MAFTVWDLSVADIADELRALATNPPPDGGWRYARTPGRVGIRYFTSVFIQNGASGDAGRALFARIVVTLGAFCHLSSVHETHLRAASPRPGISRSITMRASS